MSSEDAEQALRCIADLDQRGWAAHIKDCQDCRNIERESSKQERLPIEKEDTMTEDSMNFVDLTEAKIDSVKTSKTQKIEGVTIGGDLLLTLRIPRPGQSSKNYRRFMELLAVSASLEQETVDVRITPADEQQLMMFDGYSVIERLARDFRENIESSMPKGTAVTLGGPNGPSTTIEGQREELPYD